VIKDENFYEEDEPIENIRSIVSRPPDAVTTPGSVQSLTFPGRAIDFSPQEMIAAAVQILERWPMATIHGCANGDLIISYQGRWVASMSGRTARITTIQQMDEG
jgi:hypothetical protein